MWPIACVQEHTSKQHGIVAKTKSRGYWPANKGFLADKKIQGYIECSLQSSNKYTQDLYCHIWLSDKHVHWSALLPEELRSLHPKNIKTHSQRPGLKLSQPRIHLQWSPPRSRPCATTGSCMVFWYQQPTRRIYAQSIKDAVYHILVYTYVYKQNLNM